MRLVVALGGNALGKSVKEQQKLVIDTATYLADYIEAGHQVVLAHGNGPQVGMINIGLEEYKVPLAECVAMSQGYIGYHLQNALQNELLKRNINKNVVSIVTQVEVDINDEAFSNPVKPIGSFYSKEEALLLEQQKGFTMKEDSGRGYRRVVASPKPVSIVEIDSIKSLIEAGNVVISCGGGGIPVIKEHGLYKGVPAVIDKDNASSKLANLLDADMFIILTEIDGCYINFRKDNEIKLGEVTVDDMLLYAKEDHFAKGAMLPKVLACCEFASTGKISVIASLENAKDVMSLKTGTIIKRKN